MLRATFFLMFIFERRLNNPTVQVACWAEVLTKTLSFLWLDISKSFNLDETNTTKLKSYFKIWFSCNGSWLVSCLFAWDLLGYHGTKRSNALLGVFYPNLLVSLRYIRIKSNLNHSSSKKVNERRSQGGEMGELEAVTLKRSRNHNF